MGSQVVTVNVVKVNDYDTVSQSQLYRKYGRHFCPKKLNKVQLFVI